VSVALIVRDAQAELPATLDSVRSLADEIVVVDTGSADYTRDVARRYTPRVVGHRWDDDFSAARNAALAEVQGEWVLWLDAGETLPAADVPALRHWIEGHLLRDTVGLLFVGVPPARADGSAERAARGRLHPNLPGLRFNGRVAEGLAPTARRLGLREELIEVTLWRSAAENLPQRKQARARRNLRLVEREIAEHGPTPRRSIIMGEARLELGLRDQAAGSFRRALETSVKGSLDSLWAYYGLLTALDGVESAREAQLATCLQALESFPLDAQLLCAMGSYLQARDRFDLAARSFEAAYRFGQVHPELWHLADLTEVAAAGRGLALQLAGQESEALAALGEALAVFPESPRLHRRLGELHVQRGDQRAALEEFGRLPLPTEELAALRAAVRGACLAARQNWPAAIPHLQTAYDAGCRDVLCVRWFVLALLAIESFGTAQRVVAEWVALEPDSGEAARYRAFLDERNPRAAETDRAEAAVRRLRVDPAAEPAPRRPEGARATDKSNPAGRPA
jgi:tetratricopeptide (TPR) repeat protein